MKHALTVERIGDDRIRVMRSLSALDRITGSRERGESGPWCAEITGTVDEYDGIERRFLRGNVDYTNANSKGSRGITLTWIITAGLLYEASYRTSWKRSVREFFMLDDDGTKTVLSRAEALVYADAAQWAKEWHA